MTAATQSRANYQAALRSVTYAEGIVTARSRRHDALMSAWIEGNAVDGEAAVDRNLRLMGDAQDKLAEALRRLANLSSYPTGQELDARAERLEAMAQQNRAGFAA